MTLFEVKVPIFRTDIYHLLWRPSTFAACQSSLRPTRQPTYELVRALLGGFYPGSALLAESEPGFFDVFSSGLDVVVMREVVDELYAFRDFGSGRSSRLSCLRRVFPTLRFRKFFLAVSSSAGLPDASFPEDLLFLVVLLL